MDNLKILVEGNQDKQILTSIFVASKFPIDRIEFIVCNDKKNIINNILSMENFEIQHSIALFDTDRNDIPDAQSYIESYIGRKYNNVFCAIPSIDAWLFADDLLLKSIFSEKESIHIIERLPLPEEIPYPKYIKSTIFRSYVKSGDYSMFEKMNIERASARTPSLKVFLSGVASMLGIDKSIITQSYSRNFSNVIMMNLVKEVVPSNTVLYQTLDGTRFTAADLEDEIRNGTNIGNEYASDILRIARDILKRKVEKG